MRLRRNNERRIFFPWEGPVGLRALGLGKARPVLLGLLVVGFVVWIGARERERAGIRQTRATLLDVREAMDHYLAENDGGCPKDLDQLLGHGSFKSVPTDAWGRRLRLVCPVDRPGYDYLLMSDGPDGKPGGLDRIE